MNKIFSVLLLVTFSYGIVSCSNEDPSGATSQLGQVLDQPNSTDDMNRIDLPVITGGTGAGGSCYLIDSSTIDNSTIDKSSISDNSSIKNSTVNNCSTVTRSIVDNSSTIDYSIISDSTINNSSICVQSTIDNSTIDNSTVCNSSTVQARSIVQARSTINNSSICAQSTIDNSTIDYSTICNSSTVSYSTIYNSSVCNSTFDNTTVDNSTLCYDNVSFSFADSTIRNQIMTEQTDPTVDNVTITSTSELVYSQLNVGDNVSMTATFSEPVIVTDDDGIGVDNASSTPTLHIWVGDDNRTATYVSGGSDNRTVFQYTIVSEDNDTNGISIGANALDLNSGTIRDASGNYANIKHSSEDNNSSYKVDTDAPKVIDNVSITGADATSPLSPGHTMYVTVSFNDNVTITCRTTNVCPKLNKIRVDGSPLREATYARGNNSFSLVFNYLIQGADEDSSSGVGIDSNSLFLNGGTIKDAAGNEAITDHSNVPDNSSWTIK